MLMNRLFCALGVTLTALSGCTTVTDMITSNLPESHSGRPSIVVRLREQEAYLNRGGYTVATSRISSGREGYRTPIGHFQVIRKDEDHHSSIYGDYVNASGQIVKANVDSRRDRKPPHSHFVGTDCIRVTCQACPHRMDALGCPIGKRANFTVLLTLGRRWW